MAGASLLALLDDIASVLDDVALMTKVAAKKTAGVLGDDLALNAQQVSGVSAERELPVVWAVAVGSFRNKLILVPAAIALSALAPWTVAPLLMAGGVYLCYEGVEKLTHRWLHSAVADRAAHQAELAALADPAVDIVAFERDKIRGAIRTDFILSAEIIVIALGTVQGEALSSRIAVVCGIALLMTVGVYGLVAAIVKMDDAGLHLLADASASMVGRLKRGLGAILLATAPRLLRLLAVVGTAAMFLVGGGILVHGLPALHHVVDSVRAVAAALPLGSALAAPVPLLADALVGVAAGAAALAATMLGTAAWGRLRRV